MEAVCDSDKYALFANRHVKNSMMEPQSRLVCLIDRKELVRDEDDPARCFGWYCDDVCVWSKILTSHGYVLLSFSCVVDSRDD